MIHVLKKQVAVFNTILHELPEITYVGNPILREKTKKATITEGRAIGNKLGVALLKYRKIAGYGRGLAAPQIGIGKAVFVTYLNDELRTYINPVIVQRSKTYNYYKELCLSAGLFTADVKRPECITMTWTDGVGKKHKEQFDGFLARLFQHEEAHLHGVVHLDQAEPGGIEFTTANPLSEKLRVKRT